MGRIWPSQSCFHKDMGGCLEGEIVKIILTIERKTFIIDILFRGEEVYGIL